MKQQPVGTSALVMPTFPSKNQEIARSFSFSEKFVGKKVA
jgi:hypothetical protein